MSRNIIDNLLAKKALSTIPILLLLAFIKTGVSMISPRDSFLTPTSFSMKDDVAGDKDHYQTAEINMAFNIDNDYVYKELDLVIEVSSSYLLFFDNEEIGRNGEFDLSTDIEISQGTYFNKFRIPKHLIDTGAHLVKILLISAQKNHKLSIGDIYIGESSAVFQRFTIIASLVSALAGINLIIAIYYLTVYLVTFRKITFLYFSGLCFSIFGIILFEYLKLWFTYPYTSHSGRLLLISIFSTLTYAFLILYLTERFLYSKKYRIRIGIFIGIVICWALVSSEDSKVLIIAIGSLATSIILCSFALYNNREGSWYGFLGILSVALAVPYYSFTIFFGFGLLIFYNLLSLSYQFSKEEEKHRQSLMRSTYFELELLKQKIKPHFLLNSLTSIISWIRVQPETGIKMIEALAQEFKLLDEIAEESLVPISTEIDLCQAHIDMMQIRKDIVCTLETDLSDKNWLIPPGILHTLIENGITHHLGEQRSITFQISVRINDRKVIEVSTPYHSSKKIMNDAKEGNGYKYIRARLQQAFPDKYRLNYFTRNGFYINKIFIYP